MSDPCVETWRKIMNTPTTEQVLAANEAAKKHRYSYPADAGDIEAGYKFDHDQINMPSHYTQLPVEAIDITEHFNFCLGNALKYIWRADHKGKPVEDLKKARWYIDREIQRRERS